LVEQTGRSVLADAMKDAWRSTGWNMRFQGRAQDRKSI